jgi:co-chaperonin GroES (HSP10)
MEIKNDFILVHVDIKQLQDNKQPGWQRTDRKESEDLYQHGKVFKVSDKIPHELCKDGDEIIFSRGRSSEVRLEGSDYFVIRASDVVLVK